MSLDDVISDPSSSEADIYMAMLRENFDIAITAESMQTADDVRKWWIKETKRRARYNLSPEQEAEIVELCKLTISLLPEPKPEVRDPSQRYPRRQR